MDERKKPSLSLSFSAIVRCGEDFLSTAAAVRLSDHILQTRPSFSLRVVESGRREPERERERNGGRDLFWF